MSEYPIGSLKREEHPEGGLSIWCFVQDWNQDYPMWRCIYSTSPGNIGCYFVDLIDTEDIGMLPGVER